MRCPRCGSENIEHTGGAFDCISDDDDRDTLIFECQDCGFEWEVFVSELPD